MKALTFGPLEVGRSDCNKMDLYKWIETLRRSASLIVGSARHAGRYHDTNDGESLSWDRG